MAKRSFVHSLSASPGGALQGNFDVTWKLRADKVMCVVWINALLEIHDFMKALVSISAH
jgi:hypothetical protein